MKDEEKRIKKLISDELDAEAKKTISEVEADMTLKDVALPGDMDRQLTDKIQEYEKQQANYRLLSEEDKEALRLGKEMLAQRGDDGGEAENKEAVKVVKFRKRRRMAVLLVAVVGVMILGFGMTSIGDLPFFTKTKKQEIGDREMVQIDNEKESKEENGYSSGVDGEEQVYANIKEKFGFDPVKIRELPRGANFLEGQVDSQLQEAWILYNYNGKIIEYRVFVHYRDKSSGYDIEDNLIEEYVVNIKNIPVDIKQYKIEKTGENQVIVHFEYQKINYILNGDLSKDELEGILKNLKFL